MRVLRKTVRSMLVSLFGIALVTLGAMLTAAACSDKVTLSFETFGGTAIAPISEEAGAALTLPEDPEKEGYVFVGWYTDRDCTGQSAALPYVMPETSVTYYAGFEQYPVLTLDAAGGTLAQSERYVKAGTPLIEALSGVAPIRTGLTFGGWLLDGRALEADDVMPEAGVTLTARYIASYRVEIALQTTQADTFETVSVQEGMGWEGALVQPAVPSYEHFYLDEQLSTASSLTLGAGENVLRFVYRRAPVALRLAQNLPGAEEERYTETTSFYGAEIALSVCDAQAEGYAFLGWAYAPQGAVAYHAGDILSAGSEDITLYAVWGQPYADGRGSEAVLALASYDRGDGYSDALLLQNGASEAGAYDPASGYVYLGDREGRLDGRGYFLMSDAGGYDGFDLASNCKDAVRFGSMTLDFRTGTARYELGERVQEGTYTYLFDEAAGAYTGRYAFAGEEEFLFLLQDGCFLREGEEKGGYTLYDCFSDAYGGETLTLDGLGGAVLSGDAGDTYLSYAGDGTGAWVLTDGTASVRILTGERQISFSGAVAEVTPVFVRYDAARAGTFTAANGDTLTLDGFGSRAMLSLGGTVYTGAFAVEGDIVRMRTQEGVMEFLLDRAQNSFSVYSGAALPEN